MIECGAAEPNEIQGSSEAVFDTLRLVQKTKHALVRPPSSWDWLILNDFNVAKEFDSFVCLSINDYLYIYIYYVYLYMFIHVYPCLSMFIHVYLCLSMLIYHLFPCSGPLRSLTTALRRE
jgi:hypothetical protein